MVKGDKGGRGPVRSKPIILSTGIAKIEDIQLALKTCRDAGNNQIAFANTKTKYMRIVLEEAASPSGDDIPWMVKQMKVFGIQ